MRQTFIETTELTAWVRQYLSDEALSELQKCLLNDPHRGVVMPACGGMRKMRVPIPSAAKVSAAE